MFIKTEQNIYETNLVDMNGDPTISFIVKGTRRRKTLAFSEIICFSSKRPTMFIRTEKNIYETDLAKTNDNFTKVTFIDKGTQRKKTLMLSVIIYFSSKWPTKRQDVDIDSFKRPGK